MLVFAYWYRFVELVKGEGSLKSKAYMQIFFILVLKPFNESYAIMSASKLFQRLLFYVQMSISYNPNYTKS
jgi:hypothetical protein